MNDKDYGNLPGIRRSDLWKIKQSPMHFRHALENPEEPTPALIFGQAAHKYILEPESFFDEFAVMPSNIDRRTKSGKEAFQHFSELAGDRTIITETDLQTVMAMRQALLQNADAREIINGDIRTEQAYTWTDPETGEPCKVKADIVTSVGGIPYVIDYKTTASCSGFDFERSCRRYGYDMQAGMYCTGIDLNTLERHEFAFIAQEKTAPYASRVYWCDPSFVEQGERLFHDLLRTYHDCKTNNVWPGYESTDLYGEE